MNFSSLIPPANPAKLTYPKRSEAAVAGTAINKDAPKRQYEQQQEQNQNQKRKRQGQDRRKVKMKPALELRVSGDRREQSKRVSIDITV